jgi:mannan endo-1,4-beta-mannosidase
LADTQRMGRHRQASPEIRPTPIRRSRGRGRGRGRKAMLLAVVGVAIALVTSFIVYSTGHPVRPGHSTTQHNRYALPDGPSSYIGLYAPKSNSQVKTFTARTGIKPRLLVYYSGWPQPFRMGFATIAAREGAVPLVQMNPTEIDISAIVNGQYDSYLNTYAMAVHAYGHPVILSFGHEMNGYWYSWGHTHTSPATFVAAWRHIVTLFRRLGVRNVTWLWTVNTVHLHGRVPSPAPWWPGKSYVNWVGIDGYYTNSSSVFASVFGPTIVAVRALTHVPILIAETSATPASAQPEKIANLFAGVHLYGLLGFVWFDSYSKVDWRISNSAALDAFRRGAKAYLKPAS